MLATACIGTKSLKLDKPAAEAVEKWEATQGAETITAYSSSELKEKLGRKHVFLRANGPIYDDGSCKWPTHKEAARAAWAAVQLDNDGAVIVAAQGTVAGGHRQGSLEGEHYASLRSMANAEPGSELVVGCAAAIAHNR